MIRNRSLKRIALYLLTGVSLILLTEYIVIRYKIKSLEDIAIKKDYTHNIQLNGQQIALLTNEYRKDQEHLSSQIISQIDQQDLRLKTLRDGGRVEGTDIILTPLSRLPRMSFDQLEQAWMNYKKTVSSSMADRTPENDSIVAARTPNTAVLLSAQSLILNNWSEKLKNDLITEAEQKKNEVRQWVLAFIFLDIALLAGLFYLFYRHVIVPIKQLKQDTVNQHQNLSYPNNELGELTHEVNEVLEQLKDATDFVVAIGEGKLDFDYKNLDTQYTQGKNKLADSLIAMQIKLKDMNLDEQRRQWANEGLTKFVDILRSSNDNIHTLGDKIISALVKYTGSNQGGLYILNDEEENDKFLELISLFAFNSKKYEKQKVRLGEGILGQTFLEKETTLLTEIPEEYIRITSGLGGATPKALVMVPLKVDKEVYGIVELASFKPYQQYEIEFVEKLAETIASTLASVKVAQKNRQLIEQFREQAEEMHAQEEEMRQNMEELQATQEEMARKERDYIARIQALEASTGNSTPHEEELAKIKEAFRQKESSYQKRILELEEKLAKKPSGDWQLAEDMEKTFKMQLEAMRITQDEMKRDKT